LEPSQQPSQAHFSEAQQQQLPAEVVFARAIGVNEAASKSAAPVIWISFVFIFFVV
jgi:hypothetical protein